MTPAETRASVLGGSLGPGTHGMVRTAQAMLFLINSIKPCVKPGVRHNDRVTDAVEPCTSDLRGVIFLSCDLLLENLNLVAIFLVSNFLLDSCDCLFLIGIKSPIV